MIVSIESNLRIGLGDNTHPEQFSANLGSISGGESFFQTSCLNWAVVNQVVASLGVALRSSVSYDISSVMRAETDRVFRRSSVVNGLNAELASLYSHQNE